MLKLSGSFGSLKAADDRADHLIILRIQRVKDRFRQNPLQLQRIQKVRRLATGRIIADAVISGIRTKHPVHPRIIITLAAIVQLHHPTSLMVLRSEEL